MEPKYKRILLKVSGEALAGDKKTGLNYDVVTEICKSIKNEIDKAFSTIFDRKINIEFSDEDRETGLSLKIVSKEKLGDEGYRIKTSEEGFAIEANEYNGLLYGAFRFIEMLRLGKLTEEVNIIKTPDNPLRMLNH